RRRRKEKAPEPKVEVKPQEDKPAAEQLAEKTAATVADQSQPVVSSEKDKVAAEKTAAAAEKQPEPVVAPEEPRDETGATEKAASAAPPAAEDAEPAPVEEVEAPAEPVAEKAVQKADTEPAPEKPQRATANRAKILGRVELPQTTEARPAREARPAAGRGKPRPQRTVVTPMPAPAPAEVPGKEGRNKKKKKGKGGGFEERRGAPRSRRARMEVFEPERGERYRKVKKASKQQKKTEITVSKAIKRKIRIADSITVGELAKRMGVKANDLIRELMGMGHMVTINHPLDFETAEILAAEFNYEVENIGFDEDAILQVEETGEKSEDRPEDLVERPPVVT
ncbi:MAG: translation initiation factor IF-2, partial [Gammaproteobacteria bacterium]